MRYDATLVSASQPDSRASALRAEPATTQSSSFTPVLPSSQASTKEIVPSQEQKVPAEPSGLTKSSTPPNKESLYAILTPQTDKKAPTVALPATSQIQLTSQEDKFTTFGKSGLIRTETPYTLAAKPTVTVNTPTPFLPAPLKPGPTSTQIISQVPIVKQQPLSTIQASPQVVQAKSSPVTNPLIVQIDSPFTNQPFSRMEAKPPVEKVSPALLDIKKPSTAASQTPSEKSDISFTDVKQSAIKVETVAQKQTDNAFLTKPIEIPAPQEHKKTQSLSFIPVPKNELRKTQSDILTAPAFASAAHFVADTKQNLQSPLPKNEEKASQQEIIAKKMPDKVIVAPNPSPPKNLSSVAFPLASPPVSTAQVTTALPSVLQVTPPVVTPAMPAANSVPITNLPSITPVPFPQLDMLTTPIQSSEPSATTRSVTPPPPGTVLKCFLQFIFNTLNRYTASTTISSS